MCQIFYVIRMKISFSIKYLWTVNFNFLLSRVNIQKNCCVIDHLSVSFHIHLMRCTVACTFHFRPWIGSIKPNLQHIQFCCFRLSVWVIYLCISLCILYKMNCIQLYFIKIFTFFCTKWSITFVYLLIYHTNPLKEHWTEKVYQWVWAVAYTYNYRSCSVGRSLSIQFYLYFSVFTWY